MNKKTIKETIKVIIKGRTFTVGDMVKVTYTMDEARETRVTIIGYISEIEASVRAYARNSEPFIGLCMGEYHIGEDYEESIYLPDIVEIKRLKTSWI